MYRPQSIHCSGRGSLKGDRGVDRRVVVESEIDAMSVAAAHEVSAIITSFKVR